mmetsp:Transcript_18528/g.45476  ORF Transcript_18528/g.45476 Transcript_18528/m.45476 type:complete len:381 (-) Transcript_18528:128-1270(-)
MAPSKAMMLAQAQAKAEDSEEDSEMGSDEMGDSMLGGYPGPMAEVKRIFMGAVVTAKQPAEISVPEDPWRLVVMRASLGEKGAPDGCRVVLKIDVDGISVVVAHLRGGAVESLALGGIEAESGANVTFSITVTGAKKADDVEVHLAGYYEGVIDGDDSDDEDMDSDEEGMLMGDDDDDDEEEEEEAPPAKGKKAASKKVAVAKVQDRTGGVQVEGELLTSGVRREMGLPSEDEDDDEEEGDDDDDDDDEEEEPVTKKRPAPGKAAPPPAKAQKGEKGVKAPVETPKKDAPKSAPATPGSAAKKEVPGEVKAKVRQILSGQAAGIKGADFPREWQKAHGTPFKDAFMKLGFKKQGEFMSALGDVVDAKGSGSEVTFFPKKK